MASAEETMRGLYAALDAGDMETFVNAIDDDVVARVHGSNPHAGEYAGKQTVLAWMQRAMSTMEESRTIEKFVASGDTVVVIGQETITAIETGKSGSGAFVHHWVVRDGKIVEYEDFETAGAEIWDS